MKILKKRIIYSLLIFFFASQLIRVNLDNPQVEADLISDKKVKSILKKSCYDCHSNETIYPFYSYVFPVSFFMQHHIEEGREELNFSNWENLSSYKKASKANDIIEQIEDKEMPLWSYLLMHPKAKISQEEFQILKKWSEEMEKINEFTE